MPFILQTPKSIDFTGVTTGDTVTRLLGGVIPMQLNVTHVDETLIHCGAWTFDRRNGVEVDEDLPVAASFLSGFVPQGADV